MSANLMFYINQRLHSEINKFARENGITFEEAAKRVVVTVGGVELKPVMANEMSIDFTPEPRRSDPAHEDLTTE